MCGYPLTFSALRDGTMDLLGVGNNLATTGTESAEVILAKKNQERDRVYLPVSIGLLAVITGIGLMIDNVGTVVSFSGALIGSMVIYIIPSIMNICNIQKGVMKRDSKKFSLGEKVETVWNYFLTILGMFLGVAGVWVNLKGKAAH